MKFLPQLNLILKKESSTFSKKASSDDKIYELLKKTDILLIKHLQ